MSTSSGSTPIVNNLLLCLDAANPESYYSGGTNLLPYSTYNSGDWWNYLSGAATVTPGQSAPDGTTTAVRFASSGASNSGFRIEIPNTNIPTAATYTYSFYVKQISGNTAAGNTIAADVNDGNPSMNYWGNLVANTWVRVSSTATLSAGVKTFVDLHSDGTDNYTLDYWGAQLEPGNLGVYQPTNGVPITRPAGTSATVWQDVSGNANNGTLVNSPAWSSGYFTFVYTSSQSVSFASNANLNFLGRQPYTLEAWVYPTRNPGTNNWTGIFDREFNLGAGRDGYNIYFLGSAGTDTYFTTERWCSGVNTNASVTVAQSLSVNAWQHIVATYDGANLRLYRNGVLAGGPTASSGSITNATTTLTIALRGGNYFDGRVSLTRVYNTALSATQVLQNFNSTRLRYGI